MNGEFTNPLPHEINAAQGIEHYECRPCGSKKDLHWFRGTSCPVRAKPDCTAQLEQEWAAAYSENNQGDD